MAQALAAGIAKSNEVSFVISDPSETAQADFQNRTTGTKLTLAASNREVFENCETVFLAVKPQFLVEAMEDCHFESSDYQESGLPLLVSVLAGVTSSRISELTGIGRVIRVMPNTPCLIGQGACAMSAAELATAQDVNRIKSYLESVGIAVTVPESMLDAVTGLSGSGPAFVFSFIESLIDGAVANGLPVEIATELATQTVLGSARLAQQSEESTAKLRERVTSPGGTTLAGLRKLEETKFNQSVTAAVTAAVERSRELGAS